MTSVSVVIPTRNRYDYLKMAVESVLSQTHPVMEVIIVDDASNTEVASKMAARWGDHPIVSIHTLPECSGVSYARNVGKQLSTSDYLILLDDDDMILPDMIEKCLEEMGAHDIVGCRIRMISDDVGLSKKMIKRYRWGYSKSAELYALDSRPLDHLLLHAPSIHSFFGRAEVMKSIDFDEQLQYGEDLDYWLRLAREGYSFHKVEFEGAIYRMHRKNASGLALYNQKRGYYEKQINNHKLSVTSINIALFKFGLMSIFQWELRGIPMFLTAMASPASFLRHSLFFIRFLLAGIRH